MYLFIHVKKGIINVNPSINNIFIEKINEKEQN